MSGNLGTRQTFPRFKQRVVISVIQWQAQHYFALGFYSFGLDLCRFFANPITNNEKMICFMTAISVRSKQSRRAHNITTAEPCSWMAMYVDLTVP